MLSVNLFPARVFLASAVSPPTTTVMPQGDVSIRLDNAAQSLEALLEGLNADSADLIDDRRPAATDGLPSYTELFFGFVAGTLALFSKSGNSSITEIMCLLTISVIAIPLFSSSIQSSVTLSRQEKFLRTLEKLETEADAIANARNEPTRLRHTERLIRHATWLSQHRPTNLFSAQEEASARVQEVLSLLKQNTPSGSPAPV